MPNSTSGTEAGNKFSFQTPAWPPISSSTAVSFDLISATHPSFTITHHGYCCWLPISSSTAVSFDLILISATHPSLTITHHGYCYWPPISSSTAVSFDLISATHPSLTITHHGYCYWPKELADKETQSQSIWYEQSVIFLILQDSEI